MARLIAGGLTDADLVVLADLRVADVVENPVVGHDDVRRIGDRGTGHNIQGEVVAVESFGLFVGLQALLDGRGGVG